MTADNPRLYDDHLALGTARISQALQLIAEQAACGSDEALSLLTRHAVETGGTMQFVALDVLDGVLHFTGGTPAKWGE